MATHFYGKCSARSGTVEGYCDSASFEQRQIINAWRAGIATTAKCDFISDSCYLFILPVKLRSSALVVCTVGRGERCRGVPTGRNGSRASALVDLHLSVRPPRRLRSSSQGSRQSAKSDSVFS